MKFLTMLSLFLHFVTLLLFVSTISHGLTLKLIPPSSPESPFYLGNLSYWERAHFYVQQSNARVHYLSSRALAHTNSYIYNNNSQPSDITLPVDLQHLGLYSVKIGIGEFPTGGGGGRQTTFKSYYLVMDTGSDLLWLQCDGCKTRTRNKCFSQQGEPPFPNRQSKTYHAIQCAANPRICFPYSCKGKLCHYTVEYGDNTHSKGKLAYEEFTFEADHSGKLITKKLRFGCGEDQEKVSFARKENNKLAGILGLNSGKDALQMQIPETDQKFSYCLPHKNTHPQHQTYLTFGSDIPQTSGFLKTRMTVYQLYLIYLQDISIDHQKLSIPRKQQSIAMSIDSGSSITRLIKPVYEVLETALVKLFSGDPNLRRTEGTLLCYERVQPERELYSRLPTLTFNLEGVDFEIGPDGAFEAEVGSNGKQNFCLTIESHDEYTILGAYQQTNYRFIHDLKGKQLLFKKEKC